MRAPRIHMIGIGGIGMSGIARLYLEKGFHVQGSDVKSGHIVEDLRRLGAKIYVGHDASLVAGADQVVYSSAVALDHPERQEALKRGVRLVHRAEALAELCRGKRTIAVAGTHGKTTTTAMIGTIFKEAGRDPSVVVGGWVEGLGGNARSGSGAEIVIEADESDASFLEFSPVVEVITNIEEEHMDHYESLEKIVASFRSFIRRLPENSVWIGCAEDEKVSALARERLRPCTLYGWDPEVCDVYARDYVECPEGRRGIRFSVWQGPRRLGELELRVLGRHNALNALGAVSVALAFGISFETAARALAGYQGVGRRFDIRFESAQFLVVDDYAHHPTEIRSTLAAAKSLGKKRIFAVFGPHRYSRTRDLFEEFTRAFDLADRLLVTDIYAASETPLEGVTGEKLALAVKNSRSRDARYVRRAEVTETVLRELQPGDLLIFLGAGDLYAAAEEVARFLKTDVFRALAGKVLTDESLSKHTSLRVGGPVDYWIEPEDLEDLKRAVSLCRENRIPYHVFGLGSNTLPPDAGLRGAAICLGSDDFKKMRVEADRVVAGAGVPNSLLIQFAVEQGFGGCEFLSGIPGNLGGALAMNAGSHGQALDARVASVRVLDKDGAVRELARGEIPFSYRHCPLEDVIFLEAVLDLPRAPREKTQKVLDEYYGYRARTQDLQHPSAGCMFKNPVETGRSSGQLIEAAGLKGHRLGQAQVSTKHANFIVNLGGARASDIAQLIREVQAAVKEKFGVWLETEVRIL